MVKFDWWELKGYFGKHPKQFKRDANKQIRNNILFFLKDTKRGGWATQEDIFEATLEQTDLFKSDEGRMFFAKKGIQQKIGWAVNELRRKGYPIISGSELWKSNRFLRGSEIEKVKKKYGQGYRYADEHTKDFIEDWNEKVNAWLERKSKLTSEYTTDKILMERIIERLENTKRVKEAQKMKKVLIKYEKERQKIKDEDDEES